MRLLVTGGAGYLGSEVCARAAARGWDVLATWLARRPPAGRPVRVDLRDDEGVQRTLLRLGPEAVIHTAYRQAEEALDADVVRATRNVASGSARFGARLVHLSTDLVFDGEIEGRYTEADEPRPVSAYGAAKLAAERLVAELDPAAVVVRTSLLYGKPGEPGPQERLAARTDVVFHTDEMRCPVLVGELADALLELAEGAGGSGPLHLAGPDAISRYELARLLAPDPGAVRGGPSPVSGRARNVALDSSRAAALLRTRLRGVKEALRSL